MLLDSTAASASSASASASFSSAVGRIDVSSPPAAVFSSFSAPSIFPCSQFFRGLQRMKFDPLLDTLNADSEGQEMKSNASTISSPAPVPSSLSSASSVAAPGFAVDPHTTAWRDVDLLKFSVYMSFFSTAENALFYPFYVMKTLEQSDRSLNRSTLQTSRYHLEKLLKTRGLSGFYRGFMVSNFTSLPSYAVYMSSYTWTKDALGYRNKENSNSLSAICAPFIAGFVADAASVALYVPGDVVVQRLQIHNSPYSSFIDACVKISREEGLKGFYRGFGATFMTSGIASAVWWLIYENSKAKFYAAAGAGAEEQTQRIKTGGIISSLTEVNRIPQLAAGFVAGTLTSTLINPLDVVKTRLQIQDAFGATYSPLTATQKDPIKSNSPAPQANSCAVPQRKYRNVFHGLYRLYTDEGLKGCFRGVVPKLISRGPLSALSSILYELTLYLSRKDEFQ